MINYFKVLFSIFVLNQISPSLIRTFCLVLVILCHEIRNPARRRVNVLILLEGSREEINLSRSDDKASSSSKRQRGRGKDIRFKMVRAEPSILTTRVPNFRIRGENGG